MKPTLSQSRRPRRPTAAVSLGLVLLLVAASDLTVASPSFLAAGHDEVCKPAVPASDPVPPCVDIEIIEALCYPNGTGGLFLEAHAQCMCRGSYFAEWTACRQCLFLHGRLSERDLAFYKSIATVASTALCGFLSSPETARPTAIFRDLFTSAEAAIASPTTGAVVPTDQARGNDDVALYFTPSGSPGPGPITGSATAATGSGGQLVLATGRPSFAGHHSSSSASTSSPLVGVAPTRTPIAGGVSTGTSAGRRNEARWFASAVGGMLAIVVVRFWW
jgi:hypothetical protein